MALVLRPSTPATPLHFKGAPLVAREALHHRRCRCFSILSPYDVEIHHPYDTGSRGQTEPGHGALLQDLLGGLGVLASYLPKTPSA